MPRPKENVDGDVDQHVDGALKRVGIEVVPRHEGHGDDSLQRHGERRVRGGVARGGVAEDPADEAAADLGAKLRVRGERAADLGDELSDEVVLRGEEVVEGTLGDARLLRDVLDAQCAEALPEQVLPPYLEQARPQGPLGPLVECSCTVKKQATENNR